MNKYKLLRALDMDKLEEQVNLLMLEGYLPHGPLAIKGNHVVQPMLYVEEVEVVMSPLNIDLNDIDDLTGEGRR